MTNTPDAGIQLNRELKMKDALALAFGCMIGWGWVVLVGEWVGVSGTFGAVGGFLAAGAVLCVVGVLYAELASTMPEAGGAQVYSERAFGKGMAFICSWALILAYLSITIFEAVALPQVAEYIVGPLNYVALWEIAGKQVYLGFAGVGVAGALLMAWLNIRGIKSAAVFQTSVTGIILISGLLLMGGSGLQGSANNFQPAFINGIGPSIIAVMVMAPFLMGGFDVIPQAAAEIDLPAKKIGKLIIFAVLLGAAWYCLIILSVSFLFTQSELKDSSLPAIDAARKAWGPWGAQVLVLGGIAGILTSWNGFLVGGSRAVYALAKSGMLPSWLAKIHPKYHTPVNAIIALTAFGCIAPFFGRQLLVWIANAGSMGFVVAYTMVALSFVQLRRKEPNLHRPFKAPAGITLGLIGIVSTLGMFILYFPPSYGALAWPHEWFIVGTWSFFGLVFFLLSRRQHVSA